MARWHVKTKHPGRELNVKCRQCGFLSKLHQAMVDHSCGCIVSPVRSVQTRAAAHGLGAIGDPLVTPVRGERAVAMSSPNVAGALTPMSNHAWTENDLQVLGELVKQCGKSRLPEWLNWNFRMEN